MRDYKVAIVGATGVVGEEMRKILEERNFPLSELRLLASAKSKGEKVSFKEEEIEIQELNSGSFKGLDFALFSAGATISREYAPIAARTGATVIDNSSAFRLEKEVPLVVPEVNLKDAFKNSGIIANPNCSTIQLVLILKPLNDYSKVKRVVVSTYQAVSGTGREAIQELLEQTESLLMKSPIKVGVYPHQIAFNVLPQCDIFLEDGYTLEEKKLIKETQKILGAPEMRITATAVRVPVLVAHSEAVNIETEEKIASYKARQILENAPGVQVLDDPKSSLYPLPVNAAGSDLCLVGRIREDNSLENGLNLWIVADNLRKGAALNAVQIAEALIR